MPQILPRPLAGFLLSAVFMLLMLPLTSLSGEHPHASDLQCLQRWQAGAVVNAASVAAFGEDRCFAAIAIPDSIFSRMVGKTYGQGCTVPRSHLRYLRLLHRDAKGRIILGEMVCHRDVAQQLTEIFHRLYLEGYPIERMRLADVYDGDDLRSMAANNTSCFNFRRVAGSRHLSAHSRGVAVDINPLYNPYVRTKNGKTIVLPESGRPYADRSVTSDYRIVRGDNCHRLFTAHGFQWGGNWRTLKDYQHFELAPQRTH